MRFASQVFAFCLWATVGASAGCESDLPQLEDLAVVDLANPADLADVAVDAAVDVGPSHTEQPLPMPELGDGGSAASVQPVLAVHGDTIAAAFITNTDAVRVATALSTDRGSSFASTGVVPLAADEQAADPSLAFDSDGILHVAYLAKTAASERVVYTAAYDAATSAWRPRQRISPADGRFYDAPWIIAGAAGQLFVAYTALELDADAATQGSLILARGDGGSTWQYASLSTTSLQPTMPAVVRDELGVLHLAYTDAEAGVYYARSEDSGATLLPVATLGQAAIPARPGLAASAGKVYVSYYDDRPGIVLRRSTGGGAFSTTFLTSGPLDLRALHPACAVPSPGRVAVAFYAAPSGPDGRWRLHLSADDGDSFGPPLLLSSADLMLVSHRNWPDWLGDHETLIADASGALYSAWTDNRSGVSHVFFTTLVP